MCVVSKVIIPLFPSLWHLQQTNNRSFLFDDNYGNFHSVYQPENDINYCHFSWYFCEFQIQNTFIERFFCVFSKDIIPLFSYSWHLQPTNNISFSLMSIIVIFIVYINQKMILITGKYFFNGKSNDVLWKHAQKKIAYIFHISSSNKILVVLAFQYIFKFSSVKILIISLKQILNFLVFCR